MKVNYKKEIVINDSPEKVWDVIGKGFVDIGSWATSISSSAPRKNESGELEGRSCQTSFGAVHELIDTWDDEKMSYSYVMDGLPPMFKSGSNVWSVVAISPDSSKVLIDTNMEIKPLPAFLMGWMLKPQLNKSMDEMLQELKYFVENGSAHPKKQKALKKAKN